MAASPSVATLQSLLRSSPHPDTASTSASSPPVSPPAYANTYSSPAYWAATLSSTFGYGSRAPHGSSAGDGAPRPLSGGKAKGKARARIPTWSGEEEQEGPAGALAVEQAGGAAEGGVDEQEARWREVDEQGDELDKLVDSILWQAGTDPAPLSSTDPPGPLLVIACSRIPPSSTVSHYALLDKLRSRLEAFAMSGHYSVVLLVNPTPCPPSTSQLVSSYLSLARTTRKNLRKLWVVGGGWWTRIILTLFTTTLLSLKVSKRQKIVQCSSLSSLARELEGRAFVGIEFPLEVYTANAATEGKIEMPKSEPPLPRAFGEPLEELTGKDGDRLPPLVRNCVDVLLSQGPESIGIFRRSPSAATVKVVESAFDRGHPVSLASYPDAPYIAASILKLFLRSLPSPIFPPTLFPLARNCPRPSKASAAIAYIQRRLLPLLPPSSLLILQQTLLVLSRISTHHSINLMTADNLVICLCPALIGGIGASREEVEMCRVPGMEVGSMRGLKEVRESGRNTLGGVVKVMIEHYDEIFDPSLLDSLAPSIRRPVPHSADHDLTPRARTSPRSAILPIPEDGGKTFSSSARTPSSPPPSRSAFSRSISPSASRRGPLSPAFFVSPVSTQSSNQMERSASHSSLSSSTSSTSSALSASLPSPPRITRRGSSTIQLPKSPGSPGFGTVKKRGEVVLDPVGVRGVFVGAEEEARKDEDGLYRE
ncbi:hypothetical protein JCM21900_004352 [Sporobolomyces salmonicolor]